MSSTCTKGQATHDRDNHLKAGEAGTTYSCRARSSWWGTRKPLLYDRIYIVARLRTGRPQAGEQVSTKPAIPSAQDAALHTALSNRLPPRVPVQSDRPHDTSRTSPASKHIKASCAITCCSQRQAALLAARQIHTTARLPLFAPLTFLSSYMGLMSRYSSTWRREDMISDPLTCWSHTSCRVSTCGDPISVRCRGCTAKITLQCSRVSQRRRCESLPCKPAIQVALGALATDKCPLYLAATGST